MLSKNHKDILLVDEHPGIIDHLQKNNIPCIYGDMGDIDFLHEINIKHSKMIMSTVKKFDENMVLLKTIKQINPNTIIVLVSNHIYEAIKLYEQ
jgi:Trk K+ transport system NAD-binding subunit